MHVNVLAKKHNAWPDALIYKRMTWCLQQRKKIRCTFQLPRCFNSRIPSTNIDDKFWWNTCKNLACNWYYLLLLTRAPTRTSTLVCTDGHQQLVLMPKPEINWSSSTGTVSKREEAAGKVTPSRGARAESFQPRSRTQTFPSRAEFRWRTIYCWAAVTKCHLVTKWLQGVNHVHMSVSEGTLR